MCRFFIRFLTKAALMFPVPDQFSILVDFLDPMKWNIMSIAVRIGDLEGKMIARGKADLVQRHQDNFFAHAIVIADHEISFCVGFIPAHSVEQFVDGDHGGAISPIPDRNLSPPLV